MTTLGDEPSAEVGEGFETGFDSVVITAAATNTARNKFKGLRYSEILAGEFLEQLGVLLGKTCFGLIQNRIKLDDDKSVENITISEIFEELTLDEIIALLEGDLLQYGLILFLFFGTIFLYFLSKMGKDSIKKAIEEHADTSVDEVDEVSEIGEEHADTSVDEVSKPTEQRVRVKGRNKFYTWVKKYALDIFTMLSFIISTILLISVSAKILEFGITKVMLFILLPSLLSTLSKLGKLIIRGLKLRGSYASQDKLVKGLRKSADLVQIRYGLRPLKWLGNKAYVKMKGEQGGGGYFPNLDFFTNLVPPVNKADTQMPSPNKLQEEVEELGPFTEQFVRKHCRSVATIIHRCSKIKLDTSITGGYTKKRRKTRITKRRKTRRKTRHRKTNKRRKRTKRRKTKRRKRSTRR